MSLVCQQHGTVGTHCGFFAPLHATQARVRKSRPSASATEKEGKSRVFCIRPHFPTHQHGTLRSPITAPARLPLALLCYLPAKRTLSFNHTPLCEAFSKSNSTSPVVHPLPRTVVNGPGSDRCRCTCTVLLLSSCCSKEHALSPVSVSLTSCYLQCRQRQHGQRRQASDLLLGSKINTVCRHVGHYDVIYYEE